MTLSSTHRSPEQSRRKRHTDKTSLAAVLSIAAGTRHAESSDEIQTGSMSDMR
jgi:hypothetical protein